MWALLEIIYINLFYFIACEKQCVPSLFDDKFAISDFANVFLFVLCVEKSSLSTLIFK